MVRVRAPELPSALWLNTDRPISLKQLKGRIVLLDFWTYGCINCLHILPDLEYLAQKYKDHLTVIGVHSAKFENEQISENIRQAIWRYDIQHPVIVDQGFAIWHQYTVRAWPTLIVIDPAGYIVAQLSGEGHRARLDHLIAELIQKHQAEHTDLPISAPSPVTVDANEVNLDRAGSSTVPSALPSNTVRPDTVRPDTVRSGPVDSNAVRSNTVGLDTVQNRVTPDTPLAFPGQVLAEADSDRLFIADTGHHRIIITTLAGELIAHIGLGNAGLWDGDFDEVQFSAPQGMAFDRSRQVLYVADTGNHCLRQVNLHDQTVETLAGTGQQSTILHPHSGDAHEVRLNSPWGLVPFHHFLIVSMAGSHQIWAINLETDQMGTLAGTGAEACLDGDSRVATFAQPSGLTTDGKELFVADSEGSTIRAVELDNTPQTRTICGSGDLFSFGDRDGQGTDVRLQHCLDVAYSDNQLWIADTYNHKIKQVDLQTQICRTIAGSGTAGLQDGVGLTANFYEPSGLSWANHRLYVADTNNHAIRCIDLSSSIVTTLPLQGVCNPKFCVPNS